MANEILVKPVTDTGAGKQIRFCVSGSFAPASNATNWTQGTPTNVALTLSSLGNGAGRQSAKVDLGATHAERYEVLGCISRAGTTTGRVDYYWAPSASATTATGNVNGNDGTDALIVNQGSGSPTDAEYVALCQFIGSLMVHNEAVVISGYVGTFRPGGRYGQLIVVNNTGTAFAAATDTEHHQVFNPILDEIQ